MRKPFRAGAASAVWLAAGLAAAPVPGAAQVVVAEASMTTLSVGDGALTELVFPVAASWRLAALRFDANTAFAIADYEQDGVESSLSGLTDITVRTMLPLLDDRARVIVAANIPTGTKTLSEDELPVAAILTTDILALPVRSFGSGAGVTTGLALARPTGSWVLGGIVVYRVGSAYEPVTGSQTAPASEFRPGSELRVRLAAERPTQAGVAWRVAGSWSHFGSDRADEEDVFIRGDRIMAEGAAEFPVGRGAGSLFAWNLYRSESEMRIGATAEPAPASNLAGLGGQLSWPFSRALTVRPRAVILVQTGEEGFGGGDGWMARLGAAASYQVGALRFEPALLGQLGVLNDTDITGLVIRGGVLWGR